jgi:hypothetical protein
MYKTLCVLALLAGLFVFARTSADGASTQVQTFTTTGVYFGYCGNEITTGVLANGSVTLYGFGNLSDPGCQYASFQQAPLPVSAKGLLGNLAVASEEDACCSVPSTVTLYVDGNATQLSCTVSYSNPNCSDSLHKIAGTPSDTFFVLATCVTTGDNCAQGLQVTVDRMQLSRP